MRHSLQALCRRARTLCGRRLFGLVLVAVLTAAAALPLFGMVRTVRITDGETTRTLRTVERDALRVLTLANIPYHQNDVLHACEQGGTLAISIDRACPVTVTVGDRSRKVALQPGTVADALAAAGVTLDEYDLVNYALDEPLTKDMYIDVVDINYLTETVTEPIPYATKTVYSDGYVKGETMTLAGKAGSKSVTYRKTVVNGEITKAEVLSETVLTAAVDAKTIIGTRQTSSDKAMAATSAAVQTVSTLEPDAPIPLDADGYPLYYKKHITAQATAYTYVTGARNICSTGVKAQPGYIAVNPKVIPYGTKMYIRTADGRFLYGYAVAADTGGFARTRPNNVDLFFPTYQDCVQFGRRDVEIFILE